MTDSINYIRFFLEEQRLNNYRKEDLAVYENDDKLLSIQEEIWKLDNSTSNFDSTADVLSGKLKDLLVRMEKEVIQVDSECIVSVAARKV